MKNSKETLNKKPWYMKSPPPLALLFGIIILVAILSFIIPSGQFERVEVDGRTLIDAESFSYVEKDAISVFDIFRALPNGLISAASLVFLVLIIGGSMEVFQKSDALNIGLSKSILKFGEKGSTALIIGTMVFFSFLGAFLGWAEGAVPFVPLAVALAIGLGYDSLVGVGMAVVGTFLSFSIGPSNPYTVGVSHEIAGLPLYSGFGFRMVLYVIVLILGIHHVLKYANKIKKDPSESLMIGVDTSNLDYNIDEFQKQKFTNKHGVVIAVLVFTIFMSLFGIFQFGWYLNEMSAMFIFGAIVAGYVARFNTDTIIKTFIRGAEKMMHGALIIGVARGIQWTLEQGGIADTVIYNLSLLIRGMPNYLSAIGMFIVQSILNFLIPSGSGQAMATMPIMIPLADLVGVTRQTATLAFQFGDGFSNLLYPTMGTLLIYLAFGNVPFERWLKFIWSLMWKLLIVCIVALMVAVAINYGPF